MMLQKNSGGRAGVHVFGTQAPSHVGRVEDPVKGNLNGNVTKQHLGKGRG